MDSAFPGQAADGVKERTKGLEVDMEPNEWRRHLPKRIDSRGRILWAREPGRETSIRSLRAEMLR